MDESAEPASLAGRVSRTRTTLARLAHADGLVIRGGFRPSDDDRVPPLPGGDAARTLVLLGQAGGSLWPVFSVSAEYGDGRPDPLNRWSERVGRHIAAATGGLALFPHDGPPFHPFVRWATRGEALRPSRIGVLMHPRFGLWHAYRFALTLPIELPELSTVHATTPHGCDSCRGTPCLSACPVDAFSDDGYDVEACHRYLHEHPDAPCHHDGCRARAACPEGGGNRYSAEQIRFHMRAFHRSAQQRLSTEKDA